MTAASDGERAFASYLAELVKREDRAGLAALRRGLGKQPGEATEMFPYVVRWLGDSMPTARQNDYFLVAALFAAHQGSWPAERGSPSNLGASFRLLAARTEIGSIEKRFAALLSAEREDLPEHLRHAVSLLKAHEVPVDWAQLLRDLRGWNSEKRWVQRAWAQVFWHA